MSSEMFLALVGFAFVSSVTPGPNNTMLMASGANFGVWRSLPHMFGVGIGFSVMIVLVGVGLMQLFDLIPILHTVLQIGSILYLLWLSWKIATAAPKMETGTVLDDPPEARKTGAPLTFYQAAAFQWVNPKAWTMATYAITNFATNELGERLILQVGLVAAIFGLVNLPCVASWTVLGQQMRRFLTSPARLRGFNITMAALLLLTLLPIIFG